MACKHECQVGVTVLPGDTFCLSKPDENIDPPKKISNTVLGPGLRLDGEAIHVTVAGVLRRRDPAVALLVGVNQVINTFVKLSKNCRTIVSQYRKQSVSVT